MHGHLARDCPSTGTKPLTSSGGSTGPTHGSSFKSGRSGPKRGRGKHVRFGGMNVLYDSEGIEYPVDDYGQVYVPFELEQTGAGEIEEEKDKSYKKLKRSYASVAAVGATRCSTGIGPYKNIKNWREAAEYLHRVDRARILRREGSVITCSLEALRHEMERNAGQQQRSKTVVGYCSCGAAYPSRVQCGGNRKARRARQRANRERLRDERVVSRMLARVLSPSQGGSAPRNLETIGKLQVLSNFSSSNATAGKENLSRSDNPMYVGLAMPTHRVEVDKNGKKQIKSRKIEDGLLMVVAARIYGRQCVH